MATPVPLDTAELAAPMPPETPVVEEAPAVEEVAPAEGYVIEIVVKADGTFAVSQSALVEEAVEDAGVEPANSFDNLGAALKAVMDIVKANPVGVTDQQQFEAGYTAQ